MNKKLLLAYLVIGAALAMFVFGVVVSPDIRLMAAFFGAAFALVGCMFIGMWAVSTILDNYAVDEDDDYYGGGG